MPCMRIIDEDDCDTCILAALSTCDHDAIVRAIGSSQLKC